MPTNRTTRVLLNHVLKKDKSCLQWRLCNSSVWAKSFQGKTCVFIGSTHLKKQYLTLLLCCRSLGATTTGSKKHHHNSFERLLKRTCSHLAKIGVE